MGIEFQILSASLEDRYPLAVDGERIEPSVPGCVGFLFGRTANGRSLCARVEGIRPKLFFALQPGEPIGAVQRELEHEVGTTVEVKSVAFAHFYGFERDETTASGRAVHAYVEASYPDLRSWRHACRLRREDARRDIARRLCDVRARVLEVEERIADAKRASMVGGARASLEATLAELRRLKEDEAPSLQRRLAALGDDGGGEEDAAAAAAEARSRPRTAHEHMVAPLTRMFHELGATPSSWVRVPLRVADHPVTSCELELDVSRHDIGPIDDRDEHAPHVVLYYDIETMSLDPAASPVIQISMVFVNKGVRDRHLVALGTVDPIERVTVHSCDSETDVLLKFASLVQQRDPDFVVAYNGVNFDNAFLDARAKATDTPGFYALSRFPSRMTSLRDLSLSSAGMGDNLLRYFDMTGRCVLDWFIKLKRDLTSEPNYKLNHFAQKFCGAQKEDVHYKEIPVLQRGTSADRARLGKYCVVDSELLEDLNQARTMIVEILEFSRVFGVLPEWVYFRGQQVRFIAKILAKARTCEALPLLLNTPEGGFFGEGVSGYEGATVNQPKRNFYKTPVAVLDWQSLYPSIMRAYNLSHDTHVLDPAHFDDPGVQRFEISPTFVAHFVRHDVHKGILPRILEELQDERAIAKRRVKEFLAASKESATDDARARNLVLSKVWDGRQLAVKVSANSFYGACGAMETGKYPDLGVSATVTLQGREAMVVKKTILPQRFPGVDVIYGDTDSVMLTFAGANDVASCAAIATEAADFVTDEFAARGLHQMKLEFEKIFFPYLLEGKKRYAGLKYEPGKDDEMICKGTDCKGLETERKDTLPFVKEIMHGCFDLLLHKMDEHAAMRFFEERVQYMIDGHVDFEQFVMRKNLSSKVEHKTDTIVQARVNALRKQREPGTEVAAGEQVEYVIVRGHKNAKTTELAEDPAYARANQLPLNLLWYFEHAIEEPVRKVFDVFDTVDFKAVCARLRARLHTERLGLDTSGMRSLLAGGTGAPAAPASRARVPRPPLAPPPRKRKK